MVARFHFPIGIRRTEFDQENLYVVYIANPNDGTVLDVTLEDATPPFGPSDRSSTPQALVLSDWDPFSFLLFMTDGPASDIGIIGVYKAEGKETWSNLILDESSPSLPLDEEMNETAIMGYGFDLTSTDGFSSELKSGESHIPPSPILYVYASDGTIIGWNICNLKSPIYPGMTSKEISQVTGTSNLSGPVNSAIPATFSPPPSSRENRETIDVPSRSPLQLAQTVVLRTTA